MAGLELTASTLSKIETGVRSVYDFEVQAFAQVLGLSIASLFTAGSGDTSDLEQASPP